MMAKPRRRKRCPKVILPAETVERAVAILFNALLPGGDPEQAMEMIRGAGAHHRLMELAHPETDDLEGMEYGGALDEFEGDLSGWLEDAAASYAEHRRRLDERDRG
jgi:hypothetical protein